MIEWGETDLTTADPDDRSGYPVEGSNYAEHEENDRPGGGGAGALAFGLVVFFALISIVVIFATIP